MKTKLLVALLTITLANPAFALRVLGNVDCGEWVGRKNGDSFRQIRVEAWLTGFMSGLNIGDDLEKDLLRKVSADQIFLWMDNYCRANPLKTLAAGGQALMIELNNH